MANTYKALSTVTVGAGGSSSITFTNIPQTYTDLVVVWSGRISAGSWGATSYIYFNNTISTGVRVFGGGTSVIPSTVNNIETPGSGSTANTFGYASVYINKYASDNQYKSLSFDWALENNSATDNYLGFNAAIYSNNSPVTSITILPTTTTVYNQYSTFTLYGVFNADVSSAPATPTIGTATLSGPQSANVTFTGVANAASYTVTPSVGSSSATGTTSPIYITNLTAGSSTTFTVKSNNPLGSSANSAASNAVTPVGGFDSISTAVGTGSSNTITFSSIPSGYTHLQIRGIMRNDVAAYSGIQTFDVRFNGDTNFNYSWSYYGTTNDSTPAATSQSSNTSSAAMTLGNMNLSNGGLSNTYGIIVMDIDYYSSNKHKNVRAFGGVDQNAIGSANTGICFAQGNWRNTTAINSISLITSSGGSWTTGTTFALYGIRAAS